MNSKSILTGLAFLLPFAQVASAEGTAVSIVTGLPTGLGAEVTRKLVPQLNARLGAGIPLELNPSKVEVGHNKYDVNFKIGGLSALLDWHPTKGNFRLSGGVLVLPERMTFDSSKPPFTLGSQKYTASQITRLRGETKLGHRVAPAFLIGWGNAVKPGKHWGFNAEAGLAYTGDTAVDLRAEGPLANDPATKTALETERRHVKDKTTASAVPVVRLGVSFQF